MAYKILRKVSYNGINKENWIENRDPLMQRSRRAKSTWLDVNSLENSGRDLQADLRKSGRHSVPRKFVKLENMSY